MRHDNPDLQVGDGTDASRIVGRVLLETIVASNDGVVEFELPVTPYSRFVVEIDDWAAVGNNQRGLMRFGVGGVIRVGLADYGWTLNASASNDNLESFEDVDDDEIVIVGDNTNLTLYGDKADNSFSTTVNIDPGSGSDHRARAFFQGSGPGGSTGQITTNTGGGYFRGAGSQRIDAVQFRLSTDLISRGTFRLYGTE